ncbi:hypothetical protein C7B82_06315 [Stenomitos frigidus ULC18]|uniref:Peptidase C39-like domain-containing protein n=1 Tax=Stenomitos frigidus ULC18 TaxID=2107698 RepID=A0A2T1EGJ8_9CYAN|nr:hypothetical protein C7B82_06315 [Stenomitos frigidus ULC18]
MESIVQQFNFSVQLLPGMIQLAKAHQLAGQQHDNLCGPYWVAMLLRSRGFHQLTPEQVAQLAGSVLPTGDPKTWLPERARSRQDYGLALPVAAGLGDAGTSAQGLITAVTQLSNGAYTLLPIQTEWSAARVETILERCHHPEWNAVPLCNIRTKPLWGSSLPVSDAIAYLNGATITPPPPDWNVGHFFALAGTVEGSARSLILTCDTYPSFGWQGYHLQPSDAIAQALNRGDGNGGGILLLIATQDKEDVEQVIRGEGFAIGAWDNGSPS